MARSRDTNQIDQNPVRDSESHSFGTKIPDVVCRDNRKFRFLGSIPGSKRGSKARLFEIPVYVGPLQQGEPKRRVDAPKKKTRCLPLFG